MNKIKYIMIFILVILLTGCGQKSQSSLNDKLLTNDDMYWIDSTVLKEKVVNFGSSVGYGTSANSFDSLNYYAYQFNKNGTCSRISTVGEKYLKDDIYIYLYPYSIDPKYELAKDELVSVNGLWIADRENCTYTIDENKITITVTSCRYNLENKEEIAEGTYSIDGNKLKITWKKQSIDYIYDDSGNPIDIKQEDVYVDTEYTKSNIVNDIEKIVYTRRIEPYLFYDVELVEYNIDEHIRNNTFFGNMLVDLWVENTLREYNSNMSIDDFLFVNGSSLDFSKGKYIKNSFYYYEGINGTRYIYIPHKKYSNEEIMNNIANHYGTDTNRLTIYACYGKNEYNSRYCGDIEDPLNKETNNLMDALEYSNGHYYGAGFYKIELDSNTIKIQLDSPTIWEIESYESIALQDECLYKKK